jgi:hypothetical protein
LGCSTTFNKTNFQTRFPIRGEVLTGCSHQYQIFKKF